MSATPAPVPPELWASLARLDARCDFWLTRQPWRAIRGFDRCWSVTIKLREGRHDDQVSAREPALVDALSIAVTEATARGWAQ